MKNHPAPAIAMALLLLPLLSCGGGHRGDPGSGKWDGRAKGTYVAGWTLEFPGWPRDNKSYPSLWINGRKHEIRDLPTYAAFADVFVSGDDAYATLFEYDPSDDGHFVNTTASLYKNGERLQVLSKGACPLSVFVAGGDVYVAGVKDIDTGSDRAVLWRNGVESGLSHNFSYACDVAVSDGGDVWVVGVEGMPGNRRATLWTNGEATRLGSEGSDSYALSLAVSGEDVYVVGGEKDPVTGQDIGKLWKNGREAPMQWSGCTLKSVHVSGNDVYVVGNSLGVGILPIAVCWKNGSVLWADQAGTEASCVFVADGVVHVAGQRTVGSGVMAAVWEDGRRKDLGVPVYGWTHTNGIFAK